MARSISNDTDRETDLESPSSVAVRKEPYVTTMGNGMQFGLTCLTIPGMVLGTAVVYAHEGKDLRELIANPLRYRDMDTFLISTSLGGGTVATIFAPLITSNLWLVPAIGVAGAIGLPLALLNGGGLLFTAVALPCFAFLRAKQLTVNSRAYKALTGGTPNIRSKIKDFKNKPLYLGKKPGPR